VKATIVGLLLLGLLALASIVQASAYYPLLPERVACRFDPTGAAVGWQSKGAFFLMHLGLVLGMALGVVPLLCVLLRFAPARMINMPHKEYWLAAPRERQTRSSLVCYTLWVMDLTLALVVVLMELTYRANLAKAPSLGRALWVWLAVYGLAMAVWVVMFCRRFRRVASAAHSGRAKER